MGLALALITALGCLVAVGQGRRQGLLYRLGVALGITLYQSRFGFSAAFRTLLANRQGRGVYAHVLMLALASLLFAPLLASPHPLFGARPQGFVYPVGLNVAAGAFVFGIDMEFASACPAGILYDVGAGYVAMLLTLAGFLGGTLLGVRQWRVWTHDLPSLPPLSLATSPLGYGGALLVQLAALGLLALVAQRVTRRQPSAASRRSGPASPLRRVIQGPWPPWVGALVLAVLNALTLLVKGAPWGTTTALALVSSKLASAMGIAVASWPYWAGARGAALRAPLLADATLVMDAGLVLGALLAAAVAGGFALRERLPWSSVLAAVLGGVLIGYGAQLADGCTVGAYFSGIASFSVHGWLWAVMAVIGSYAGEHLITLAHVSPLRPQAREW